MLVSEKKRACENNRNYSVPSQLRAKIHSRSASLMGFCLPAYVFLRSAQQVRRPTEKLQIITALQESDTEVQKIQETMLRI